MRYRAVTVLCSAVLLTLPAAAGAEAVEQKASAPGASYPRQISQASGQTEGRQDGFRLLAGDAAHRSPMGSLFLWTARLLQNGSFESDHVPLIWHYNGAPYSVRYAKRFFASVQTAPSASYAGLGWATPRQNVRRWRISLDLGVFLQGSPALSLTAGGPPVRPPVQLGAIGANEDALSRPAQGIQLYPVVSLAASIRF